MPEMPQPVDYDRVWEEVYGDLQDLGPTHRHMARLMRTMLAPLHYESALDVGVGYGHNLPVLTQGRQLERVAGVDISERAVEHVSARWEGSFRQLDITRERLTETYDLVNAALILEHLHEDEAALANIRAMTSKYLLVTTIGGDYERYRPWEQQVGHVRNYSPAELRDKLAQAGFTVDELICWGFPLYSPIARLLQNRMKVSSELAPGAKLSARILYPIFHLNSSRRGDLLLVLARPR